MQTLRLLIVCAASLALCNGALAQATAKPSTAKSVPKKMAVAVEAETPAATTPPPAADEEQLVAAALTLFGQYDCEYDQKLMVSRNPSVNGYVDVAHGKRVFTMKPVRSPTGALRLEEVSGSMLMVQIPSKSMLMDTKLGSALSMPARTMCSAWKSNPPTAWASTHRGRWRWAAAATAPPPSRRPADLIRASGARALQQPRSRLPQSRSAARMTSPR